MIVRKIVLALLLSVMASGAVYADSPITSTPFHEAYMDVDIVKAAKNEGKMTEKLAEYLFIEGNPLDVKMAVINAIGWDIAGQKNAEWYTNFIYKTEPLRLDKADLTGEDLMVIGYLMIMDDYFHPAKSLEFFQFAKGRTRYSFTAAIIIALAYGQKAMENDFCSVWKLADGVFSNETLLRDMRADAIKIIKDYVIIYKEYCK